MKYLFLDFDGVMNRHEPIHPLVGSSSLSSNYVQNLNSILNTTGAKIVLVSAWRYMILTGEMTLRGFNYMLQTHGVLQDCLVGHTEADEMCRASNTPVPNQRGQQIIAWLEKYAGRKTEEPLRHQIAILDDLDLGYTSYEHGLAGDFFHVKNGLNWNMTKKVIQHLNRPLSEIGRTE